MIKTLAADIPLSPEKGFTGFGLFGLEESSPEQAPSLFNTFISGAIGVMTVIAAIWFLFVLITGAISMISSGGDKTAMANAQKRITNGLIGLVVVIASVFIIELIGKIFGFNLILNPGDFIQSLWK